MKVGAEFEFLSLLITS